MAETTRPRGPPPKAGWPRRPPTDSQSSPAETLRRARTSPPLLTAPTSAEDTGLIGGMSAVAVDEAHRVVQIQVAEIAPHPFNDQTPLAAAARRPEMG